MKLFLILALATGSVWLLAAVWIQTSTRSEVEQVLDARLAEAANMVSSLISDHRIEVARVDNRSLAVPMPRDAAYSKQLSCQIWSLDGGMVGRSDGAPDVEMTEDGAEGYSRSVINGETWRVYTLINEELGVRVMVGDSLAVRDGLVHGVLAGLLLPAAVALPILAVILWISVARGLAPLNQLANTLRTRSPSDLSALPDAPAPREIKPVRTALNSLFERVASARDVERDFTTYAAHELKTPLSGLRTQAQVMRLSDDPLLRERALAAIERSVDRTDRMVRQLLELAAVERSAGNKEHTDLAALMRETVKDLEALAEERFVTLEIQMTGKAVQLRTNPFLLQAALRNVVENAILASPHGARASVALQERVLTVCDEGEGIPPELLDRVQKRFTRGPASGPNGSGLGLSIVSSAMERLGGEVQFHKNQGQRQGQKVVLIIK